MRADLLVAQGLASVRMVYAPRKWAGHLSLISHWRSLLSLAGHMTDLIYAEKDLVQSLKEYILVEEAKLSKIKRCPMFQDVPGPHTRPELALLPPGDVHERKPLRVTSCPSSRLALVG